MILKIYIASIIITIVSLLCAAYGTKKETKFTFTKEELKVIKKHSSENPFVTVFMTCCPIINILFMLVLTFEYEKIKGRVISGYKDQLEKYSNNGEENV